MFWGFDATGWAAINAIGTIATVLMTAGVAWVAWYQISQARKEAEKTRTLAACDKYDNDPILDAAVRRLVIAWDKGELHANPRPHRVDLWTELNYFESIAIGIRCGLFNETIAKLYLEPIIRGCVKSYIESGIADRASVDVTGSYTELVELDKRWQASNDKAENLITRTRRSIRDFFSPASAETAAPPPERNGDQA